MCKISDLAVLMFLLICSLSDIKTRKLPTGLLLYMSGMVGVWVLVSGRESAASLLAGICIGAIFFLISRITNEALGYGDSWVILILGGYLGWKPLLALLMLAFLFAGLCALIGLARKNWNGTLLIPFLPFLMVAYIGVMFL